MYFSVPLMRFLGLPPYLGPSFFKKCTGGDWRVGSSYEVLSKTAHALFIVFVCLFFKILFFVYSWSGNCIVAQADQEL